MILVKQSNDMGKSYEAESVNRSQMDIKHVIFEPGKNIYFLTYPPSTLIHLSHHFTGA
jgi:hypothetical protein